MGLRPAKSNANIWCGVWHEKGGWAWKVEDRQTWAKWGAGGYQSKETAEESMGQCLKGLKVEQ